MCFYVCSYYEVFNAAFMHGVNICRSALHFLQQLGNELHIKHTYLLLMP